MQKEPSGWLRSHRGAVVRKAIDQRFAAAMDEMALNLPSPWIEGDIDSMPCLGFEAIHAAA